jgi:ATP-dependent DNA helicase RecG
VSLFSLFSQRHVTSEEAAALTQKSQAEARAALEHLAEVGLVEPRGERKGRVYQLSAKVYKRLGQSAAYVRQRGFEPEQQEQMVLQYVRKHGRITRREAADLCRVSSDQAKLLLSRLLRKEKLEPHGQKRGAWYGPKP